MDPNAIIEVEVVNAHRRLDAIPALGHCSAVLDSTVASPSVAALVLLPKTRKEGTLLILSTAQLAGTQPCWLG